MDHDEAAALVLDAAEVLFYERGVQAVGMDAIRSASGVSLKRLYECFPAKEAIVVAYLRRRDERWRASLASFVDRQVEPFQQVQAVFEWLGAWFAEPGFRGCAFINSFGEFGVDPEIADIAREHKDALRRFLAGIVEQLPVNDPGLVSEHVLMLVDGAITSAAITGDPGAAGRARAAVDTLLGVAITGLPV